MASADAVIRVVFDRSLMSIEARLRTIELLMISMLRMEGREMSAVSDLVDVARAAVLTLNRLEALVEAEGSIDLAAVQSATADLKAAVDRAGTITTDAGSVTAPQDTLTEHSSAGDSGAGMVEAVDGGVSESELDEAMGNDPEDQVFAPAATTGVNTRPGDVSSTTTSGTLSSGNFGRPI
jgi:hypothetical protein